jgi:hypothetical protein
MTDVVLVVDGQAVQVWRNTAINRVDESDSRLVETAPGLVVVGMALDGATWTAPEPAKERRRVQKWLIIERVDAAGKASAAKALLDMPGSEAALFRWYAPVDSVYFDDPATVAMVEALGLDPEVIMAPG